MPIPLRRRLKRGQTASAAERWLFLQSPWNSVATKLVGTYVPQANYRQATPLHFNAPNTQAQDQGILRADYTPTAKDTIWASSVFESIPSTNALSFGGGSFPGFGQHAAEHFKIFNASYTHTFSANMLNELHGGYFRLNYPVRYSHPCVSRRARLASPSIRSFHFGRPLHGHRQLLRAGQQLRRARSRAPIPT